MGPCYSESPLCSSRSHKRGPGGAGRPGRQRLEGGRAAWGHLSEAPVKHLWDVLTAGTEKE